MDIELDERKLLPLWVCPICKLSEKPMFMDCECGESICISCVKNIDKCPFCRSPIKIAKFNKALIEYTSKSPIVYDSITQDSNTSVRKAENEVIVPEIVINLNLNESDPLTVKKRIKKSEIAN